MLFDWLTVGAQALNFLILVFLMWRFLYKPILHAIDEREKRIAAELADADAKRAEAKRERDEYQHKNEELAQQRAALLSQAEYEARAERQRLLGEARQAADALSAKRRETLRSEANGLNQSIANRTRQEVFAITRKVLTELAGVSLEERLCEVFTLRLRALDGAARASLAAAIAKGAEPALVRSAFDLPVDQRAAIQNAMNETFSADIRIRFVTAPDLVGGIELSTMGLKVGWSIAEALSSLEEGIGDLLDEKSKSAAKGAQVPVAQSVPRPEKATPEAGHS